MKSKWFRLWMLVGAVLSLGAAAVARGTHTWSTYHWARTSNPFTVQIGDNVSAAWDSYLDQAVADWNASSVINTVEVAGRSTSRCKPTAGRMEVCNGNYGQNGWLGLAQIWLSGGHISQGTAKMNDTYFSMATYNTPGHRDLVMCQEVGHVFGLGHQDENFNNLNLGTCMDYTASPDGGGVNGSLSNRAPNAHDYQLLEDIYRHVDNSNSAYSSALAELSRADYSSGREWGQMVSSDARNATFVRDFGNGIMLITHVYWAWEHPSHRLN